MVCRIASSSFRATATRTGGAGPPLPDGAGLAADRLPDRDGGGPALRAGTCTVAVELTPPPPPSKVSPPSPTAAAARWRVTRSRKCWITVVGARKSEQRFWDRPRKQQAKANKIFVSKALSIWRIRGGKLRLSAKRCRACYTSRLRQREKITQLCSEAL